MNGRLHRPRPADDDLALLEQLRRRNQHVFFADAGSLATAEIDLTALVGHRQVTDFHLVNLAASVGAVLATFDARLLAALAETDRRHLEVIPI